MNESQQLFERDRSCLIVIDVQQYFLDKLPVDERAPLIARIAWLMRVARALDIPIIATAEDIANDGPLVAALADELPPGTRVHDKMVFGLAGQPSILDDVASTGRDQFVLVGMETDVCVAHSAIGLLGLGHRVAVDRRRDGVSRAAPRVRNRACAWGRGRGHLGEGHLLRVGPRPGHDARDPGDRRRGAAAGPHAVDPADRLVATAPTPRL